MTSLANKLTPAEAARLAELEPIIEWGMSNFVKVGTALLEISDGKLYRENYATFSQYCEAKWQMTARRVYQLCEAAEVVKLLPQNVNHGSQINERQARELAQTPAEDRPAVLEAAAETGKVTAKAIRQAREKKAKAVEVQPEPETLKQRAERAYHHALDKFAAAELSAVRNVWRGILAKSEDHDL